jgi:hypothetical protein
VVGLADGFPRELRSASATRPTVTAGDRSGTRRPLHASAGFAGAAELITVEEGENRVFDAYAVVFRPLDTKPKLATSSASLSWPASAAAVGRDEVIARLIAAGGDEEVT